MARVTQKEYARRRRITPQYVNKLVSQGRIRVGKDGLVDVDQADRARGEGQRTYAARPRPQRGSNAHGGGRPPRVHAAAAGEDAGPAPRSSATQSLTAARAAEVGYAARLRKLEYEQRVGLLLPVEEVREAERRKNANIRLRLRGLGRKLAAVLAATSSPAECERLLLEEIDAQLEELARDPLAAVGPAAPAPPAPAVQTSAEAPLA